VLTFVLGFQHFLPLIIYKIRELTYLAYLCKHNGSILHTGWVKKTIFTFIFPQLSLTSKRCELLFKKIVKTDKQAHKNKTYSIL